MAQLSFFEDLDGEQTKRRVEAELERYRMYTLIQDEGTLPRLTANYSFMPPARSNTFRSETESIAIERIDRERMQQEHIERVTKAVSKLNRREREIICKCYLDDDKQLDYLIYNEMNLSEKTFYAAKKRAIYKLALVLKVEVYRAPHAV